MSVRLNEEEIWRELETAHTGILTTLRKDGMPITLPVWFLAKDRKIYVYGPAKTKKFNRIRNDPRCSFLVESGKRWAELRAVQVNGVARIIEDEATRTAIQAAIDAKYAAFKTASAAMPAATAAHYASGNTLIEITPDARKLSWDNARLNIKP